MRGLRSASARRPFVASAPFTTPSGAARPSRVRYRRPVAESNRQMRLSSRPTGMVGAENFELTEEPVPAPCDDQALVKTQFLSLDPAMRGWMSDAHSYVPPVGVGEVMRALGAGVVLESNTDAVAAGDHVVGLTGVQEHAVLPGGAWTKVDPELAPLPTYLGALGMPGLTAYFGLLDIGELKEGDTVVVSG